MILNQLEHNFEPNDQINLIRPIDNIEDIIYDLNNKPNLTNNHSNNNLPYQLGLHLEVIKEFKGSCKVYQVNIKGKNYILKIDKVDEKRLSEDKRSELKERKKNLVSMFGQEYQNVFEPKKKFCSEFGEKFAKAYYSPPTGQTQLESELLSILESVPRIPKLIIDLGACWGDCSHYAILKEYIPGRELMVHEKDNPKNKQIIENIKFDLYHKGIIARDIKPRNLILTPQREIYFIDLDICKLTRRK